MFGHGPGVGKYLRNVIFVGAFVGAALAADAHRARAQSDDSISPFSNTTGPADSTPSADYVRKQTEPPRFDPNSPAAADARRAEAAKPRKIRKVNANPTGADTGRGGGAAASTTGDPVQIR